MAAALVAGAPYWLLKMATMAKYREGLLERLGRVPVRLGTTRLLAYPWRFAEIATVWIHAVSVGEVNAAVEVARRMAVNGFRVVVSTTTQSGQRLARQRFGEKNVFYFPLDFRWVVRRYLKTLQPSLLVLMESEFWPNLLTECAAAGVPVSVVNARISDRSYPRYLRLKRLWRPILSIVSLALAQSEVDADRLRRIGLQPDRVRLGGNLKYDVRAAESEGMALAQALREHLPTGSKVLVCGSTLDGEEQMLLEAWAGMIRDRRLPSACMVLAPRHPERFAAVAKLLERSGLRWVRRTEWMRGPEPLRPGSVFLLNSIGELASVYSLASVAFVGGSLVPAGGHNPLEPAQFGVPIVMGPHFENFRGIVNLLQEADGIRILQRAQSQPAQIVDALLSLLKDEAEAEAMGARGRGVFERESGATAKTLSALIGLMTSASSEKEKGFQPK